jgi:hypothetical protein
MICSWLVALLAWLAPQRQMPIDIHRMLLLSLPLAGLWLGLFGLAAVQMRKRSLWLLVGAPFALYWPLWLLLNGIPSCYRSGNCI